MLQVLGLLCLILLSQTSYSQSEEKVDTFTRSFGIDANFINNFLPFDNTIGERGDYLFHYFIYKGENKFVRHAFDIDIIGTFQDNERELERDDARFNIDYKYSKGKRKELFKKGYFHYGVDILLNYFLRKRSVVDPNDMSGVSFNNTTDSDIGVSVGPVFGLQYKFSPRISIYTEAGIYLSGTFGIDRFRSEFDPTLDFTDREIRVQDEFVLPGAIILLYSF